MLPYNINFGFLAYTVGTDLKVVDLFCGCGGLSLSFELAGYSIVAAFDKWEHAVTCYNSFLAHNAQIMDLSDVEKSVAIIKSIETDLIIGGPPCQEFSHAGRRQEGVQADLTCSFAEIVTLISPRCFVMENVSRARSSEAYKKARATYKENGYGLTEVLLDASRYGAPQKRKRFFCIGIKGETDGFLFDALVNNEVEPITVRQYFNKIGLPLSIDVYYRHPTTYTRRAVFSVDQPAPTVRGVNRPKPSTYKTHSGDALSKHQGSEARALTIQERAAIQTFPTEFSFEQLDISKANLDQIIGNAVPVVLGQAVAKCLKEHLNGSTGASTNGFAEWLREIKGYSDRSISDVYSRLRRAKKLLPERKLDRYFIADLNGVEEFSASASDIKSQIRRAIRLYIEYQETSLIP